MPPSRNTQPAAATGNGLPYAPEHPPRISGGEPQGSVLRGGPLRDRAGPDGERRVAERREPAGRDGFDDAGPGVGFSEADPAAFAGVSRADDPLERLRERLLVFGTESLANDELLELVLAPLLPPERRGEVATRLLREIGDVAAVLAAPPHRLRRVGEIDTAVVVHLKAVRALGLRLLGARLQTRPLLSNRRRLMHFFDAAFAHETRETVIAVFTDARVRLISYDLMRVGTVNHVPVYPREILQRALECSASGLFLVHNHPSGDPTPSEADIEMTRRIGTGAAVLDITLHDHFIVASGRTLSFRDLRLL